MKVVPAVVPTCTGTVTPAPVRRMLYPVAPVTAVQLSAALLTPGVAISPVGVDT